MGLGDERGDHGPQSLKKKAKKHVKAQQATAEFEPAPRVSHEPVAVGQVLTEAVGSFSINPVVSDMALKIIDDSENLRLNMREWAIITGMIEQGIRAGYAWGIEEMD